MTREPWFRRRPPPRQSKVRPIRWEGYALLIGGIFLSVTPMLFVPGFGVLAMVAFPIWLFACLQILLAIVARRTGP